MSESELARTFAPLEDAQNNQTSLIADLGRQLFYSAIQRPLTAVSQIADKFAGTDLERKTHLISQPKFAETGSTRWHAEQIASGVGAAVPFIAAMAISKPIAKNLVGEPMFMLSKAPAATTFSRYALIESSMAGFVQGAVFEPSSGQGKFLEERLHHGVAGTITMGTMHSVSKVLGGLNVLSPGVLKNTLNNGIAGGTAALVSGVSDAAMSGRSIDGKELLTSAYAMSFTGMAMSAGAGSFTRLKHPEFRFPEVENYVARTKSGDAGFDHYLGWLSDQTYAGKARLASLSIQQRLGLRDKRPARVFDREEIVAQDGTKHSDNDVATQPKVSKDLNLFDLKAVDRVEMVARLQKLAANPLANEASMARFTDRMNKATEAWSTDRLAQLETQLKEYQQDLKKNAGPNGEFIADIKAKHKVSDTISDDMRAARDVRTKQLEGALNEFLKEEGLPEVTVQAVLTDGSSAGYLVGNVIIDSRLMDSRKPTSDQVGLLYHELVHLEQDTLRIRMFADNIGIGKEATPAQLAKLKDILEQRRFNSGTGNPSGADMRDSFIESVINRRAGVKLTEQELSAAIDYDNAVRFYDSPVKRTLHDLEKQHTEVTNSLKHLEPEQVESLLRYSVNQPALFKEKYGFAEIPEDLKSLAASIGFTDPNVRISVARDPALLKNLRSVGKDVDKKAPSDHGKAAPGQKLSHPFGKDLALKKPGQKDPAGRPLMPPIDFGKVSEPKAAGTANGAEAHFKSPFKSVMRDVSAPEARVTEPIVSQVRQILESHRSQIETRLTSNRRQSYKWYMGNIMEREAYPTGVLAFLYNESQNQGR